MQDIEVVPQYQIENKILFIRGRKVMLDRDLAILYGVETKVLNQAVKRNMKRFPLDFMFQLNKEEISQSLRSQFVILKRGLPVFTIMNYEKICTGKKLKIDILGLPKEEREAYGNKNSDISG